MTGPDILNADPYNTQAYNRYAYVMNNPMKFTDPSGYVNVDNIANKPRISELPIVNMDEDFDWSTYVLLNSYNPFFVIFFWSLIFGENPGMGAILSGGSATFILETSNSTDGNKKLLSFQSKYFVENVIKIMRAVDKSGKSGDIRDIVDIYAVDFKNGGHDPYRVFTNKYHGKWVEIIVVNYKLDKNFDFYHTGQIYFQNYSTSGRVHFGEVGFASNGYRGYTLFKLRFYDADLSKEIIDYVTNKNH